MKKIAIAFAMVATVALAACSPHTPSVAEQGTAQSGNVYKNP